MSMGIKNLKKVDDDLPSYAMKETTFCPNNKKRAPGPQYGPRDYS
jgi:hypothetical protein